MPRAKAQRGCGVYDAGGIAASNVLPLLPLLFVRVVTGDYLGPDQTAAATVASSVFFVTLICSQGIKFVEVELQPDEFMYLHSTALVPWSDTGYVPSVHP